MTFSDRFLAFQGQAPSRIPHWEHWSCPDAVTHLSGLDYYQQPRSATLAMLERYPQLRDTVAVPAKDDPRPRPSLDGKDQTVAVDPDGRHHVRWGDSQSWHFDWGRNFKTAEEALAFSPLAHPDFTGLPVVESNDYSSEEKLFATFRRRYPPDWKAGPPEGEIAIISFYNTMFMWPLLVFGWELFLEICLDDRFDRVMDEFAELNRRLFRAYSRLPVNFVICHDDIVTARGPVCSPDWMRRHIFPRYEEFWGLLRAAGKRVIFMADGCLDRCVDDVMACGASGIVTEPYTDFKAIARRHGNLILAGEGDNRVLMRNDPAEIRGMVAGMADTARLCGGYLMCIGNHIPWNVPPEAVKRYLDLSAELGRR